MPTESRENERFLALFGASPLASVLYDLDGEVERWNAAAEELFGWQADEALGRHLPEVPAHVSADHPDLPDALGRGDQGSTVAGTWLHRDGHLVVAVASSVELHDDDGRPTGAVVMFERDVAAARFEALVEHSSDVVVVYGADRRCTYVSPSAERVFGWRPDQLLGTDPRELVPAEELDRLLGRSGPGRAPGGTTTLLTHRIPHPDGGHRWVETAVTDSLDDPAVGGIVLNVRDVTVRVEAEQALREERERYRSVVENVGEAVFEIDADGRWSFINEGWRQLTGLEPSATVGTEVLDVVHPDDRPALLDVIQAVAAGAVTVVEHRARIVLPRGVRWLEARGRAVLQSDGRFGIAGILADVTERREAEERLADLALHDPLTRLANRTLLLDRLGHALARAQRNGVPLGVLFVDLDHFKDVNDTFGHAVGDELLVSVGNRLRSSLREAETIARYGGDEFVVVSEGVADEDAVEAVAERVRRALAEPFTVQGRPYTVGASVGVAVAYPDVNGGPEMVIQQADLAMYRAKGRG